MANSTAKLKKVEVNVLSRVVTLFSDNGEIISVENNTSEEFVRMCDFINTHKDLTEDMIKYIY